MGAVDGLYPSLRLCGANGLGLEGLCAPAWADLFKPKIQTQRE